MKTNNFISNKERLLLQIVALVWVLIVALCFSLETIRFYNYSVSGHQEELAAQAGINPKPKFSGSPQPSIPGLHFIGIFVFIALLKPKRFIAPLLITFFYFSTFIYGLVVRFNSMRLGGEDFSPEFSLFHKIYYGAGDFGEIAFVFIAILLFWQISILLRMLVKKLQRNSELP
jgi:hypothetical protein